MPSLTTNTNNSNNISGIAKSNTKNKYLNLLLKNVNHINALPQFSYTLNNDKNKTSIFKNSNTIHISSSSSSSSQTTSTTNTISTTMTTNTINTEISNLNKNQYNSNFSLSKKSLYQQQQQQQQKLNKTAEHTTQEKQNKINNLLSSTSTSSSSTASLNSSQNNSTNDCQQQPLTAYRLIHEYIQLNPNSSYIFDDGRTYDYTTSVNWEPNCSYKTGSLVCYNRQYYIIKNQEEEKVSSDQHSIQNQKVLTPDVDHEHYLLIISPVSTLATASKRVLISKFDPVLRKHPIASGEQVYYNEHVWTALLPQSKPSLTMKLKIKARCISDKNNENNNENQMNLNCITKIHTINTYIPPEHPLKEKYWTTEAYDIDEIEVVEDEINEIEDENQEKKYEILEVLEVLNVYDRTKEEIINEEIGKKNEHRVENIQEEEVEGKKELKSENGSETESILSINSISTLTGSGGSHDINNDVELDKKDKNRIFDEKEEEKEEFNMKMKMNKNAKDKIYQSNDDLLQMKTSSTYFNTDIHNLTTSHLEDLTHSTTSNSLTNQQEDDILLKNTFSTTITKDTDSIVSSTSSNASRCSSVISTQTISNDLLITNNNNEER